MSSPSCSACLDPLAAGATPSNKAPNETANKAAHHPPGEAAALWPAVASLSLGVFGLVTAEFLPASLLTAMAADLHVTAGAAGQAVTATALVGAVAAPAIPLLTARFDRKRVLLTLTALLLVSNLLAATAGSLAVLLFARVVLGIALGGFWSMAAALAMRLVPERLFPRAMSLVLTGVSVATVCAAPVGAWMGSVWGWRSAFVTAGVVGVLAFAVQLVTLPALPPRDQASLKGLRDLLTRGPVRIALLAVLLVISGHFAGFTYIRPVLEDVTRLSAPAVSAVLLGYGIGGFFGNFAGGWLAGRSERHAIVAGSGMITLLAAALLMGGSSTVLTAVAVTLWGFAFGAFPVGFQTWIVRAAPDQAEAAGGLLVAAFQIAIATGAIAGGLFVDRTGALGAPAFAMVAVALGGLLAWRRGPGPRTGTGMKAVMTKPPSQPRSNRRITLAAHPRGLPVASDFQLVTEPVPRPAEGQVLLQTQFLSLDPYMRNLMDPIGPGYAPPVPLGGTMPGGTVGRVLESRHAAYRAGDLVLANTGWQDYAVSDAGALQAIGDMARPSLALGALGMPGFTAHVGLLDIGQPKAGETVVVAAATGAVGAMVGQIAKLKGARVVGIAGGADKCRRAVDELGFDACVDRHGPLFAQQLAAACPAGIDVYFENVGGEVLSAVLPLFNVGARMPVCGFIAHYNDANDAAGSPSPNALPQFLAAILQKRVHVQGFIILDHYGPRFDAFRREMAAWVESGKIKAHESIVDGLLNAPAALSELLQGRHSGKVVVRP